MIIQAPLTAETLLDMPDDGRRIELWQGEIVEMSPIRRAHARAVVKLIVAMEQHVEAMQLGEVLTEVGMILQRNPDTVVAPDVAFIRADRLRSVVFDGYWEGAPDLAVEVLSPSDRPSATRRKLQMYVDAGTPMVWIVDPRRRHVVVHELDAGPRVLGPDDTLDGGDVLPGFRVLVGSLFQ
jgi:Uma2 family endonuclease